MRQKLACVFFIFLLLCSVKGCVMPDYASDEDELNGSTLTDSDNFDNFIVVGFSQIGSESDWRSANTDSFKQVLTPQNNYYLIYEDAQQKQENQLKSVRNFILQEVDYIVLDPVVETGWDTVLSEAKAARIPVIIVDRQVVVEDEDLYTCWIGSDFKKQGIKAGKWLESYLEKQGRSDEEINIVTIQGTPDSTAQIGRTNGFKKILSKNSNWHMLEYQNGEFTQAKGQEVMKYYLDTYEDIDVVVSENDNMTFGAVKAIEAAQKTCGPDGDIIVISFDAVKAALQFMIDGKINVDFECNPMLGDIVKDNIERLEKGETVEKKQYVDEQYFDNTMDLELILSERTY